MADRPLTILQVHNRYQFSGGEDRAVEQDAAILRARGHHVEVWLEDNDGLQDENALRVAARSVRSPRSLRELQARLDTVRPDVVHFHNVLHRISPWTIRSAHAAGVPTVMTLHNYRLGCLPAVFQRDGAVCQECRGRAFALPGVLRGCYRGSRMQSLALASNLSIHRALGTWAGAVDRFVALTEFGRREATAAGIPDDRIVVKPNASPPLETPPASEGTYALFLGRLSEEKGIRLLMNAWDAIDSAPPLTVVGDGPLRQEVDRWASDRTGAGPVRVLGPRPHGQVPELLAGSRLVVAPSVCFEGFPVTVVEAFAAGRPVVGTDIGAIGEVLAGHDGGVATPPEPRSIAEAVVELWADPARLDERGRAARAVQRERFSEEVAYAGLMTAYREALARRGKGAE
jgi:glycosyltransferase involved in cell wall biosynthesis